ncbi:MAG TPA: beta-hydroxyacyl-ACP dehydratase [Desulfobulbaceae bacterium]|nr:beta-hydroxyacyl-ACP dehydratase [Desulfobulbaceae bacterium]
MSRDFIEERIPHRSPFLWLDRVVSLTDQGIRAEKYLDPDLDIFRGHYPDYPLMPGVLLCEAVFQAGAILITKAAADGPATGVPVLARIRGAKFKREVRPGATIDIEAKIRERVGPAWFLHGVVRVDAKVAVQVDFSCMMKKD